MFVDSFYFHLLYRNAVHGIALHEEYSNFAVVSAPIRLSDHKLGKSARLCYGHRVAMYFPVPHGFVL